MSFFRTFTLFSQSELRNRTKAVKVKVANGLGKVLAGAHLIGLLKNAEGGTKNRRWCCEIHVSDLKYEAEKKVYSFSIITPDYHTS